MFPPDRSCDRIREVSVIVFDLSSDISRELSYCLVEVVRGQEGRRGRNGLCHGRLRGRNDCCRGHCQPKRSSDNHFDCIFEHSLFPTFTCNERLIVRAISTCRQCAAGYRLIRSPTNGAAVAGCGHKKRQSDPAPPDRFSGGG